MSDEDDEDLADWSDMDTGPFCRHWSDFDCEVTCATCGHRCACHYPGDASGCSDCDCERWVEPDEEES